MTGHHIPVETHKDDMTVTRRAVATGVTTGVDVPVALDRRPAVRLQQGLSLPLALTAALAAMSLLPPVMRTASLLWSFCGAAACLTVWHGLLLANTIRHGRRLAVEVGLRKQHYLQACAQGSVLLYWGWQWREVYDSAHLIAAQLLFAYAFDMLLVWSRRDTYTIGFSPFPVIFSINLFLWFKADWFYLQFLMIAAAFAAKELIRWEKDGRRVHIFNPSALPLALCSLVLILTGRTGIAWGQEIATTLNYAPHIYLMIFLVGLPGQYLFGVTTMTMSAVVTMYAVGLFYFALTGTYYFVDSYIPIAVFLGMHLLFTDPSTSPRTELGRIMFGMLYALSVVALYGLLGRIGAPTFYDKLLAVPIMNVMIKAIDRLARSNALTRVDPAALARHLAGRRRHLAYIGVWASVFLAMSLAQGVGDTHRGRWVPFWQAACAEDRPNGCRYLGLMVATYCRMGSGWACNEYGVLLQPLRRPEVAGDAFKRACDLGFAAGCANLDPQRAEAPQQPAPGLVDYAIVLRAGKGPLSDRTPRQLYHRACTQGFVDGCHKASGETRRPLPGKNLRTSGAGG